MHESADLLVLALFAQQEEALTFSVMLPSYRSTDSTEAIADPLDP